MSEKEPPVFIRWASSEEDDDQHIFIRSDWVMSMLLETIPFEDAHRAWTIMCAVRIEVEEGEQAAKDFLEAFGVTEH